MTRSTSLLFKSFFEFVPVEDISSLPRGLRGIYALYQKEGDFMNLMYVGMTNAGARGRLLSHKDAKNKTGRWTHCSVYEVWDNITQDQIAELEALFRHTLRKDSAASGLNIQKGASTFRRLRKETIDRAKE